MQLHSRGDVSASEASTRQSSPAELAPATSAAPEAEVATVSSLEPGDHGISAGDDHAPAERCPDGVWEAMVKKFPDLDKAWKSKESGGEQLQIRATDSLVDELLKAFLPLVKIQVAQLCFSLLPLLRWAALRLTFLRMHSCFESALNCRPCGRPTRRWQEQLISNTTC